MKRCPACQSLFADDTYQFCLDDGAVLIDDAEPTKVLPQYGAKDGLQNDSIDSLAILPLESANSDDELDYLADGITENIIENVSRIPGLKVMSRSAVFRYKGKDVDPLEAGRKMGVQAVLTGRLSQTGAQLIIKTELVDSAQGWQLWSEKYQRDPSDILTVQEEIAQQITEAVRPKLSGSSITKSNKRSTEIAEAYEAYMKGRFFWNKRTDAGMKQGVEHFKQAIHLDPDYAQAYAGLADCYNILGFYSVLPPKEAFSQAKMYAIRAFEIDSSLAEAYASLAYARSHYDWEWVAAEDEFKHALKLNPAYATGHQWLGWYYGLVGRFSEAIAEMHRAQELDPLSLIIVSATGWINYLARDYDQACRQYQKSLELDRNFYPARLWLGKAFAQLGDFPDATDQLQTARSLMDSPEAVAALAHVYAMSGNRADALTLLNELQELSTSRYISPYFVATVYAGLGEIENAFSWLEKAHDDRSFGLVYLKGDPVFDPLRADVRFDDLLGRVGLTKSV